MESADFDSKIYRFKSVSADFWVKIRRFHKTLQIYCGFHEICIHDLHTWGLSSQSKRWECRLHKSKVFQTKHQLRVVNILHRSFRTWKLLMSWAFPHPITISTTNPILFERSVALFKLEGLSTGICRYQVWASNMAVFTFCDFQI